MLGYFQCNQPTVELAGKMLDNLLMAAPDSCSSSDFRGKIMTVTGSPDVNNALQKKCQEILPKSQIKAYFTPKLDSRYLIYMPCVS